MKRMPLQIYCSPECRKKAEYKARKLSPTYSGRQKMYHKRFMKNYVEKMPDKYIDYLLKRIGYASQPKKIVELKRFQLKLKRIINEKANAINSK